MRGKYNLLIYRHLRNIYEYDINNDRRNEVEDYLNSKISPPKKSYNDGINTHNYKENIRYVHFFHFIEDAIAYIRNNSSLGWDGRDYIAYYDVSDELLKECEGFGIYPDNPNNIPVLEYAIPYNLLGSGNIVNKIVKYNDLSFDKKRKYSPEYQEYIKGNYISIIDNSNIREDYKQFIKSI